MKQSQNANLHNASRGQTILKAIIAAMCFSPFSSYAEAKCAPEYFNPQNAYPHNIASAASTPLALQTGTPLGDVRYMIAEDPRPHTLDEYLGKFCTTGLLVIKDDAIVFKRYLQGRTPHDHLLSASMAKSVLSLLVGVAIADGKLALEQRVGEVMPDFSHSAFGDATMEDLLRMGAGVSLRTSYERGADSDNRAINPMVDARIDVQEYLRRKTGRTGVPGSVFAYNGAQSAVLGAALNRRTGVSATAYLEQKVWMPMGAEAPAYWIRNQHGDEGFSGQFAATLRDYGRLGLLVMHQGALNGKQLVPADWIKKMTLLRTDKPQPERPPFYGLHIWIPKAAGGRSMFWGTNGQNIFIDPVARVVIVHTGNSADAEFNGNAHLFALRDAIIKTLNQTMPKL